MGAYDQNHTVTMYYMPRQANAGSTDPSYGSAVEFQADYRAHRGTTWQNGTLIDRRVKFASHTDIPADAIVFTPDVSTSDASNGRKVASCKVGKDLSTGEAYYHYELE